MKKTKKVQKGVIKTQIFAMSMLAIFLIIFIIAAIVTKETTWIIVATIYTIEYILMLLHEIEIIKEAAGYKVKKHAIYMFLFILILILTILVVSISVLFNNISIKTNSKSTEAIVYKIDKETEYKTEYDEDGNSYEEIKETCTNYITYTVNDKKYNNILSEKTCRYYKNDKVTIHYNKDNPSEFVDNSDIIAPILGIVLSIFVLIALLINAYKSMKNEKSTKKSKNKNN